MKLSHLTVSSLLLASLPACGQQAAPPTGPELSISVAPLTLPSVRDVEFAVAVFNAAPANPMFDLEGAVTSASNLAALVWQRPSVTSGRFGDGRGGLTYVGPCDASVAENWVALALRHIDVGANKGSYSGTGALAGTSNLLDDQNSALTTDPGSGDGDPDFQNPCPYNAPCVVKARCAPNEDTLVTFNLTIMRDARQGFFDIAVDFEDVFCSVKVDTCYEGGRQIELLFDADGKRVPTAVVASACSAGAGDTNTVMWMAPIQVTCDGGVSFTIDPTGDDDGDPNTAGREGNGSIDASMPGPLLVAGSRSAGTLTFSHQPASGTPVITIPQGTRVTRSDNGLDYLTTAPATLDTSVSTTVDVPGEAADVGVAFDGASSFASIALIADGELRTLTVSGFGFIGGQDAVYAPGSHTVVGYGVYWGAEDLSCGDGVSCNKAYWNVAINLDDLTDAGFTNCRVATAITASGSPALTQFSNGQLAGPGQTYGFVDIDAPLLDGDIASCIQGPMGSDFAPTRYGTSRDIIGGRHFPVLCHFYERGSDAPRSLGDIPDYFRDTDGNPDNATYGGRVTNASASSPLTLAFDAMGGDTTGHCRSRVLNTSTAVYFDGTADLAHFTWAGSWVGGGELGAYTIEIHTRTASGFWIVRGGYTVDLRVDEGRAFFRRGDTFPLESDGAVAIVVTRTDRPILNPLDLRIAVSP